MSLVYRIRQIQKRKEDAIKAELAKPVPCARCKQDTGGPEFCEACLTRFTMRPWTKVTSTARASKEASNR